MTGRGAARTNGGVVHGGAWAGLWDAVEVPGVEAEGGDDGGADVRDDAELVRVVRVGGEVEAAALVLRPDNRSG